MKLTGIAANGIPPPVGSGFIPFDEITTLVGANDSGKSTVLDFVQNALRGADDDLPFSRYTVFVECETAHERDQLILKAAVDLFKSPVDEDREGFVEESCAEHPGLMPRQRTTNRTRRQYLKTSEQERLRQSNGFPKNLRELTWGLGVWSGREIDQLELAPGSSPTGSLLAGLRGLLSEAGRERDVILDSLNSSSTFALRRDGEEDRWNVYWCLGPQETLKPELSAVLLDSGHALLGADAVEAPVDLTMAGSPVVCVPVGAVAKSPAPTPITLSMDVDELLFQLRGDLDSMQVIRRVALEAELSAASHMSDWQFLDYEGLAWIEEREAGDNPWERIHPSGLETVSGVAERINAHLPPTFPYRLLLEVVSDPTSGLVLETGLLAPGGGPEDSFGLNEVAEGFRPWLQFALLRTIAECRRYLMLGDKAYDLDVVPARWTNHPPKAVYEFYFGDVGGALSGDALTAMAYEIERVRKADDDHDRDFADFDQPQDRFLLSIDEPERQLHPRLQREIASWLHESVRSQTDIQLLVATHSLPFMRMGQGQVITRIRRLGDRAVLDSFSAESAADIAPVAADLGMDYGELISLTKVILWVEGDHDRVVLEGLFGERLWQHGITCIPMRGSSRSNKLVTVGPMLAELLGFSKARNVVWFDGIRDSVVERLSRDPSAALDLRRQVKDELKAKKGDASDEEVQACDLAYAAFKSGQSIQIAAHPHGDIWNLLDPGSISKAAAARGISYNPEEVASQWEAEQESGRLKKSQFKSEFLKNKIGLDPDVDLMRTIARSMKTSGVEPNAELESIVWECERLSLELLA